MESIILLVLLAIASSVFQTAANKNRKQKQIVRNTRADLPITQRNVRRIDRPISSNNKVSSNIIKIPAQDTVMSTSDINIKLNADIDNMQPESLPAQSLAAAEQPNRADYEESQGLIGNITMDELQRSIVIAEILGKPKALRKSRI